VLFVGSKLGISNRVAFREDVRRYLLSGFLFCQLPILSYHRPIFFPLLSSTYRQNRLRSRCPIGRSLVPVDAAGKHLLEAQALVSISYFVGGNCVSEFGDEEEVCGRISVVPAAGARYEESAVAGTRARWGGEGGAFCKGACCGICGIVELGTCEVLGG